VCNIFYPVMCHYTVLCVIIYKYVSSTLKDNGEQFKEPTEEFKKLSYIVDPDGVPKERQDE
jgi:hypothetical protein